MDSYKQFQIIFMSISLIDIYNNADWGMLQIYTDTIPLPLGPNNQELLVWWKDFDDEQFRLESVSLSLIWHYILDIIINTLSLHLCIYKTRIWSKKEAIQLNKERIGFSISGRRTTGHPQTKELSWTTNSYHIQTQFKVFIEMHVQLKL